MPKSSGTAQETEGEPSVSAFTEEQSAVLDLSKLVIEPIAKHHQRSAFVCSNETIQNYCRKHARQNNDAYKNRAYVVCPEGSTEVFGYYYLSLTSYKIGEHGLDEQSEQKFNGGKHQSVPAVYLGMIAVRSDLVRKGIGTLMMVDAMDRTIKIAQQAGLYALTLDAINEDLVTYYRDNFGFQTFKQGTSGLEMFLPIKMILKAMESPEEE